MSVHRQSETLRLRIRVRGLGGALLLFVGSLAWPIVGEAHAATFNFQGTAYANDVDGPGVVDQQPLVGSGGILIAEAFAEGDYRVGQQVGHAETEARVVMVGLSKFSPGGQSSGFVVSTISARTSALGYAVWGSGSPAGGSATGTVAFDAFNGEYDPSTLRAVVAGGQPNRIRPGDASGFFFETHMGLGICCDVFGKASLAFAWGGQLPGALKDEPVPPVGDEQLDDNKAIQDLIEEQEDDGVESPR